MKQSVDEEIVRLNNLVTHWQHRFDKIEQQLHLCNIDQANAEAALTGALETLKDKEADLDKANNLLIQWAAAEDLLNATTDFLGRNPGDKNCPRLACEEKE